MRPLMTTSQFSCVLRMSSLPSPGAVHWMLFVGEPSIRNGNRRKYCGAEMTIRVPAGKFSEWVLFAAEMTRPFSCTSKSYAPDRETATRGGAGFLSVGDAFVALPAGAPAAGAAPGGLPADVADAPPGAAVRDPPALVAGDEPAGDAEPSGDAAPVGDSAFGAATGTCRDIGDSDGAG